MAASIYYNAKLSPFPQDQSQTRSCQSGGTVICVSPTATSSPYTPVAPLIKRKELQEQQHSSLETPQSCGVSQTVPPPLRLSLLQSEGHFNTSLPLCPRDP
ncbi:hypothetical protein E2C01_062661 [Portunus trituberculatus]|uniref:Uncharacterized protein n=1 Tax=Portunus trituberculatus TaxID=210409 RepID=A0A5B7HFA2_PORTR|nr:hypothetical protein [Portunus trituberculatus]